MYINYQVLKKLDNEMILARIKSKISENVCANLDNKSLILFHLAILSLLRSKSHQSARQATS